MPSFLLSSSLILSQAQRLFRKICLACRKEISVPLEVLKTNRIDPEFFRGAPIFKAVGCPKCNNTGYKGRGAVMEVLPVDDEIRQAILKSLNSAQLRELAISKGMVPLKEAGLQRVRDGITSLDAALEVTGGE